MLCGCPLKRTSFQKECSPSRRKGGGGGGGQATHHVNEPKIYIKRHVFVYRLCTNFHPYQIAWYMRACACACSRVSMLTIFGTFGCGAHFQRACFTFYSSSTVVASRPASDDTLPELDEVVLPAVVCAGGRMWRPLLSALSSTRFRLPCDRIPHPFLDRRQGNEGCDVRTGSTMHRTNRMWLWKK